MKTSYTTIAICLLSASILFLGCSHDTLKTKPRYTGNENNGSNGGNDGEAKTNPYTLDIFSNIGDNDCLDSYTAWKNEYVTSEGADGFLRVKRPENGDDTVSEGIGYGMILAIYHNDKTTFDALWNYAKLHLNSNGLMSWQIDSNGTPVDTGAATDADEDIALALIFAEKIWNVYEQDALDMLNAIIEYEIEADGLLKPGDSWGASCPYNPSYIAPAWYKIFKDFSNNPIWDKVLERNYKLLQDAQHSTTGLFPDWCDSNGNSFSGYSYDYKSDACRVPWRLATDYKWFSDTRALSMLNNMKDFIINEAFIQTSPEYESYPNHYYLNAEYKINGTEIGDYLNAHFAVTYTCIAFANCFTIDQELYLYNLIKSANDSSYFSKTIKTLVLLLLSENFPNLMSDSLPTITSTTINDVTAETIARGLYGKTTSSVDEAHDVLNRSDAGLYNFDPKYDISYDSDDDGICYLAAGFDTPQTIGSITLGNITEDFKTSTYNRLTKLKIMAIMENGDCEYVYDNTTSTAIPQGEYVIIPFIKAVTAKAVIIELHETYGEVKNGTMERWRCRVKLRAVNKSFEPVINSITHTRNGTLIYLTINAVDYDDAFTTTLSCNFEEEKISSLNKYSETSYRVIVKGVGVYGFVITATDGVNTATSDEYFVTVE